MKKIAQKCFARSIVIALSGLSWIGCTGKTGKQQVDVTQLPEVSQDEAAQLKPVPNTQILATSLKHRAPNFADLKPAASSAAAPPCPKDDIVLFSTLQVKYPIVVCSIDLNNVPVIVVGGSISPTYKLDNSKLAPELQAPGSATSPGAGRATSSGSLWFCHKDSGPWQASMTSEHACSGTCGTFNTVTLTNAPNAIEWDWYGSPTDYPSDFTVVGHPVSDGSTDLGPCHPQNVAAAK